MNFIKNLFKPSTDFKQLFSEGAIIIDVRSREEYNSGHIEGSRNVPLDSLKKEAAKIKSLNKPVITVCLSGGRSAVAKSILSGAGIEVYNGGGWSGLKRQLQ